MRTLEAREFPVSDHFTVSSADESLLDDRLAAWKSTGTESYAVELVGTALALGRLETATDAMQYLESQPENALLILMRKAAALGDSLMAPVDRPSTVEQHQPRRAPDPQVAHLRTLLRADPHRAIAWADLARTYMALGLQEKARRALEVALRLAPNHRYLLRTAVCFYVAEDDPERAHTVVSRAPATPGDPWLIAAELSAAHILGSSPKFAKRAASMSRSGDFSPHDNSEMLSELATLEMQHGSKIARRWFELALIEPTENSLAQAEWASQRGARVSVRPEQLAALPAAEARSLNALQDERWEEALTNAKSWLADQFFSVKAAMVASFAAANGLLDWRSSYDSARLGLVVHPDDIGLLNNAAFAAIELGELTKAERLLDRINSSKAEADESSRIAAIATNGLLQFRMGQAEIGRKLYGDAIAKARRESQLPSALLAAIMLAREEALMDSDLWAPALQDAMLLRDKVSSPGIDEWIERVRLLGSNRPPHLTVVSFTRRPKLT